MNKLFEEAKLNIDEETKESLRELLSSNRHFLVAEFLLFCQRCYEPLSENPTVLSAIFPGYFKVLTKAQDNQESQDYLHGCSIEELQQALFLSIKFEESYHMARSLTLGSILKEIIGIDKESTPQPKNLKNLN